MRRRSVAAAAAALVARPHNSRALGVKDGLLDRCPETPSCISSQDDAARGGRSFRPPWAYDDNDWTGARDKLLVALRSEADAVVDGQGIVQREGCQVWRRSERDEPACGGRS